MGFPQSVSDAALAACGRRCCICHKFCGTKIELHHIIQVADGGEDTLENCIPLCFDCHADMGRADPRHNKGKKYSEKELIIHRDNWYKSVREGKEASDICSVAGNYICREDKYLYSKITESFKKNIQYELKNPNYYYPHERNLFQSLDYLLYESDDPSFFFVNKEMEDLRSALFSSIDKFTNELYGNTYPIGKEMPTKNASHGWLLNHGYIREDHFHKSYKELETEFKDEVDHINASAKELWTTFSKFVKHGKVLYSNQHFSEDVQE